MQPPPTKSAIHRAIDGEGPFDAALRPRSKAGRASAGGTDQGVISEILAGRRSTLDALISDEPVFSSSAAPKTTPPPRHERQPASLPRPKTLDIAIKSIADIGIVVKATRQALGLTQQRFADLAGVGRRFVSELEAGKPTLEADRVIRCCLAAGIDIFARPRGR